MRNRPPDAAVTSTVPETTMPLYPGYAPIDAISAGPIMSVGAAVGSEEEVGAAVGVEVEVGAAVVFVTVGASVGDAAGTACMNVA